MFFVLRQENRNLSLANRQQNSINKVKQMSISDVSSLTSRGTLRQKHIDAFARILGFLCLRYGCSIGNNNVGETPVVIATKALSAASHTNRLSCEDLRRSCTS